MESVVQSVWSKSKILVKGLTIGLLVLLLLIPTLYVQNLVEEREARQRAAITEVTGKWAASQTVTGPVLVVPYWHYPQEDTTAKALRTKQYATFLPDELQVEGSVTPIEKHRGIYKVMLYNARLKLSGVFDPIALDKLGIPAQDVLWEEAFVRLHLQDAKGLNDELKMRCNDSLLTLAPQAGSTPLSGSGLVAPLGLVAAPQGLRFFSEIDLNGAEQLLFTPVGKVTTLTLSSPWPHPSFVGAVLPQPSRVEDSGFQATWKSLAHKRSFPQQWKGDAYALAETQGALPAAHAHTLSEAAFGVELIVPVSSYQKTMRSVKYAVLCILLTFAAFFIMETTHRKSVHPFQYGLIGLALILFYTLLLSFSEYIGFNLSYAIAAACTIGLIGWFVKDILASGRLSAILSTVLLLMYTYVFTILQLADYSLLFGSIGLFVTLAVIMHFSKKIQW